MEETNRDFCRAKYRQLMNPDRQGRATNLDSVTITDLLLMVAQKLQLDFYDLVDRLTVEEAATEDGFITAVERAAAGEA